VLSSEEPRVGVVVLMHGPSTASSMVQVANSLVGKEHATGLDMPLSMKAEDMYEIAKEEIRKANTGRGVLLMVDMGSLT
ncbi:sigma-54-dependent transcriptional regulator, partial [Aduncisulcus paluster]